MSRMNGRTSWLRQLSGARRAGVRNLLPQLWEAVRIPVRRLRHLPGPGLRLKPSPTRSEMDGRGVAYL